MKKVLSALFVAALTAGHVYAQGTYPVKTIEEIQKKEVADLQRCNDAPNFVNDTVTIRGIVITPGDQAVTAYSENNKRRQFWITENVGRPWSSIGIIAQGARVEILPQIEALLPGDSVVVTGKVEDFGGETQINLIENGIRVFAGVRPASYVTPVVISPTDLNDESLRNKITTGEQWEGLFVEFKNVVVSEVNAPFGANRQTFNVIDESGNVGKVTVNDRFLATRTKANNDSLGTFVMPKPGAKLISLKGIIIHNKNLSPECTSGSTGAGAVGYSINPFDSTHFEYGPPAPYIIDVIHFPARPTSSEDIKVSANVTDDSTVVNVQLFYAVGENNTEYLPLNMVKEGSTDVYSATIPQQADGAFIKYYVKAVDNGGNSNASPNVPANSNAKVILVRNNGLSITDIQYTPFMNGNSLFVNDTVTVEGVVTADTTNLGFIFIQQEGVTTWGAIGATGSELLNPLRVGEKVRVKGRVQESFGFTKLGEVTEVDKIGTGIITPLQLLPNELIVSNLSDNEKYESMLVTIKASENENLIVIDSNFNEPDTINFGDYVIGSNINDTEGTIITAGRPNVASSSYVSYVNSRAWASSMKVPYYIVNVGDTFESVTGIVNYSFNYMKLFPRNNADFVGGPEVVSTKKGINLSNLTVYPNPASSQFVLAGLRTDKPAELSIIDLSGRVIASQKVVSENEIVNTVSFKSGLYIISVRDAQGALIFTSKIAIVK